MDPDFQLPTRRERNERLKITTPHTRNSRACDSLIRTLDNSQLLHLSGLSEQRLPEKISRTNQVSSGDSTSIPDCTPPVIPEW